MHLEFTRVIQFSLVVKAGGRLREFNFRKLNNTDTDLFSANVCDEKGERVFFYMQKYEGGWKLSPAALPHWVIETEGQIAEALKEELVKWQ
jgi:hypothetical protein